MKFFSDLLTTFGSLSDAALVGLVSLAAFGLVGFGLWIALQMIRSGKQ